VRPEGSGKLKNSLTSSGLEPAKFRLVEYCHNHYATSRPLTVCVSYFIFDAAIENTSIIRNHVLVNIHVEFE
jgi:hypothetical protein